MSRIYQEHFNQNKRLTEKKKEREREDMDKELTKDDRQVANKQLEKMLNFIIWGNTNESPE